MGIETALLVATVGQAVGGFIEQRRAGKAQKRANQAAMAQANEEARLAREDAAFAAREERREAARVRGQQIAAYLKSGVTLDGSPLLTASETEEQGERNARNTIANAESRARSTILRGKASQQPIQRADIFGTSATILGAGKSSGIFAGA